MLKKCARNGWLLYKTENEMANTKRDVKALP